jgi:glycosyltransferase involved in cell wall biosynthesis
MPRVSVIIPAYNAAKYLPSSIESVMAQTYPDWEIVVVDDGSSDNTKTVLSSYQELLQHKIQCIHQPNRGLPAARNAAIRAAKGEIVALLDADDIWWPARLSRSVEALDRDPETGLVHARVARIDDHGNVIDEPYANSKYLSGRIAPYIYTRRAHIMCPTVTLRKSLIDLDDAFDESLRAAEDRDLWFRIAQRSKVAYVDEILACYLLSPGSMSKDSARMLIADVTFVEKYYRRGDCSGLQRRQALATIYREHGDLLFKRAGAKASLKSYFKSVSYDPFSAINVYMLLRALADPVIPKGLTSTARRRGEVVRVKMQ